MKNNLFDINKFSNSDKNIEVTLSPFENQVAENMENFVREKLSKNIFDINCNYIFENAFEFIY